jgi:hypothetical protein
MEMTTEVNEGTDGSAVLAVIFFPGELLWRVLFLLMAIM